MTVAVIVLVFFALTLASLAVHEAGHYTAGRLLGYRCGFRKGWLGPRTEIGVDLQPGDITGWRARVIALSGPVVNLAVLAVAIKLGPALDPLMLGMVASVQLDMLLLASLIDYKHAVVPAR